MNLFTALAFIFLLLDHLHGGFAFDNNNHITSSKPLFPNRTLISPSRVFELGFFRPHNTSDYQYVGIWYTNSATFEVLWVANRSMPLPYSDRSSSLTVASDGNLKLLDGQGNVYWATNVSSSGDSTVALLDTGNLVLSSGGSILWESFDDPSDTLLQTMQVGINVVTGKKKYLTSWKSDMDPSPGNFVFGITSNNPAQAFTWINGSIPYWRSGPWDSTKFIGIPEMLEAYVSMFKVEQDTDQGTTYFTTNRYNSTMLLYAKLHSNGSLQFMYTTNRTKGWSLEIGLPVNLCETYATCGPFGVCDTSRSPICSCLEGFMPNSVEEWTKGNWTGGCKRATPLNCERNTTTKPDSFLKMNHMKLPDSIYLLPSLLSDPGNCSNWCLRNCSCLAYSYVNTIGCMTWSNQLVDVQKFSQRGADLYLRLAYINTDEGPSRRLVISLTVVPIIVIILGAAVCRHRLRANPERINSWKEKLKGEDGQVLPVFDFGRIVVATDNFSCDNKLGQGGFGPVYKGQLQDGKKVAVKRLSSNSRQGIEEFKTEILLISKLQHRNLVRLIGCCIEQEEKILIYEYLPNKSLDQFIFEWCGAISSDNRAEFTCADVVSFLGDDPDKVTRRERAYPTKNTELNWEKRFQIIMGIARGLLYLHRDSHLRVIHRDLKASNVLLDENLKPKISDFGLARMFRGTQDLGNTRRVVGTFGYMAPEYAMRGIFSEKSDIYSFGVLMLEIVSRRRNTYFFYEEENVNLLSYTWRLWTKGRVLDLLDGEILESSTSSMVEVEKCVQVGLMCVQDQAINRPNMSCVIQMLSGELNVSEPKEPVFTIQSDLPEQTPLQQERQCSGNTVTISIVQGR